MKRRLINAGIWTAKQLWLPSITNWEMAGLFAVLLAMQDGVSAFVCFPSFLVWWFVGRVLKPTAEALVPIGKWFDGYEPHKEDVWVRRYDFETRTWVESKLLDRSITRPKKEGDQ